MTATSCLGDRGALVPVCFRNSARIPSPREPLGEESGLVPAGLRGERGAQEAHGWGTSPVPNLPVNTSISPGLPSILGLHPTLGTGGSWGALSPFNPLLSDCLAEPDSPAP